MNLITCLTAIKQEVNTLEKNSVVVQEVELAINLAL